MSQGLIRMSWRTSWCRNLNLAGLAGRPNSQKVKPVCMQDVLDLLSGFLKVAIFRRVLPSLIAGSQVRSHGVTQLPPPPQKRHTQVSTGLPRRAPQYGGLLTRVAPHEFLGRSVSLLSST